MKDLLRIIKSDPKCMRNFNRRLLYNELFLCVFNRNVIGFYGANY